MSALDWRGLMEMALARGLAPEAFWAMTPVEFAVWSGRTGGPAALTRAGFDDLMATFPDKQGSDDGGV